MRVELKRDLGREVNGIFHRAIRVGDRLIALCETDCRVYEVLVIPEDVSEDRLCGHQACFGRGSRG